MSLKSSVVDCCLEFNMIVLSMPESHPEDLIHAFIWLRSKFKTLSESLGFPKGIINTS